MARGRTDQEVLCISRAAKHLEELEDPRAQARVASYLYMRFTAAGESILQAEDRETYADKRQMPLPFAVGTTLPQAAPAPAQPAPGAGPAAAPKGAASAAGAARAAAPGSGTGAASPAAEPAKEPESAEEAAARLDKDWGLKEGTDDIKPAKPKTTRAKESADGGWDLKEEEVEVKI